MNPIACGVRDGVNPVVCGTSDCWNPPRPGLIPVGDGLRYGRLRNGVCCDKIGDGDGFRFDRVGTKPTIPVFVGISGLSKASLAGTGANGPRGAFGFVKNAGGVAEVLGGYIATAG